MITPVLWFVVGVVVGFIVGAVAVTNTLQARHIKNLEAERDGRTKGMH